MLDASQAERLVQRKLERQQRREARRISGEAQAAAKQFFIDEAATAAADREALIALRREHADRSDEQHDVDLRERSDQMMPSQNQIIDLRAAEALSAPAPDEVEKRERGALLNLRNRHRKSTNGAVPVLRDSQPRSAANSRRWG